MKNLLWVGDAACGSGFAKSTHYVLAGLGASYHVSVLGLNYRGSPHNFPYPIEPAYVIGARDYFGVSRIREIAEDYDPDVIVIQNDPWNVPAYLEKLDGFVNSCGEKPKLVGFIAVDGLNCQGESLNGLDLAIFWTNFALREAMAGGMTIPATVIPLGVDLDIYTPGDQAQARAQLPERMRDGYMVLNMNRNQPRKRLDLTVRYVAEWIRQDQLENVFLFLHIPPTGDMGYSCHNLAKYYGLNNKARNTQLILHEPQMFTGVAEQVVRDTYRMADVQINTALGEGWGLTAIEGMACGLPQIGGRHSAFEEWAAPAMCMIDCNSTESNPASVVGKVMDEQKAIAALRRLYRSKELRQDYTARGLELVRQPDYRWENIAAKFGAALLQIDG